MESAIESQSHEAPGAYLTWSNNQEKAIALYQSAKALEKSEPILRSRGSNLFYNISPGNVSVRDRFGRPDYESFRPEEKIPREIKEVIAACMDAYDGCAIVRNVIDLMSDFGVQGLDITHPNTRVEKFYKEWFRRVDGIERSERFLNLLYRCGNVIVKRQTAKLGVTDEERMRRSLAKPDMKVTGPPALEDREIPWRYVFLNPLSVDVLAEELAPLLGADDFLYGVRLPDSIIRLISSPRTPEERAVVNKLPATLRKQISDGSKFIPLPPEKLHVSWYKRDDWKAWAKPMLTPLLKDLLILDKLKLADLAALDGVISSIRVWKLGSLEHEIMPSEHIILRLAQMLNNNVGGGVMDLIWGPDIELVETSTEAHRFLGETKYAPHLQAIFQGLGIPPTLSGTQAPGGFTNNYISLKTLTERLEYGRGLLRSFWENEIRLVQKAMGFRFPAQLSFDHLLTDEAAEKQLLLNLWDRNLISDETLQENYNLSPEIELVRIRREERRRKNGSVPPKASPFHDPQQEFGLKKIFAQLGTVTPSEVGVQLEEGDPSEKTLIDQTATNLQKQAKLDLKGQQQQNDHQFRTDKLQLKHGVHPNQLQTPLKGVPGQGRPPGKKDSGPRKQKTVKPRTSADFVSALAWAQEAQAKIARTMSPVYLAALGRKNLRELTEEEAEAFEDFKFRLLLQLPLQEDFTEESLKGRLATPLAAPAFVEELLRAAIDQFIETNKKRPSVDVVRGFQASAYALWAGWGEDEETGHPDDGSPPLPRVASQLTEGEGTGPG